jgi:hypothetical protein
MITMAQSRTMDWSVSKGQSIVFVVSVWDMNIFDIWRRQDVCMCKMYVERRGKRIGIYLPEGKRTTQKRVQGNGIERCWEEMVLR